MVDNGFACGRRPRLTTVRTTCPAQVIDSAGNKASSNCSITVTQ